MASIKTVAVFGGTGNLGPSIVSKLIEAGFEVTVLTRSASASVKSKLPDGVALKEIDYSNHESIVNALRGQQAVVSNVGYQIMGEQPKLIDAAIEAGVELFLPSEFGANVANPRTAALPVFGAKTATRKYIQTKAAEGKIDYTSIVNGNFLDWDTKVGLSVNPHGITLLVNGGDVPMAVTTLEYVGVAVAGVLKDPTRYKNRVVYVANASVTQNQLLAAIKNANPAFEAKVEHISGDELEKQSYQSLQNGGDVMIAMINLIRRATGDLDFGMNYEPVDNEHLGIKRFSPEEVDQVIARVVAN